MKIKGIVTMLLLVAVVLSVFVVKPEKTEDCKTPEVVNSVTINLSNSDASSNLLESRFLNMLNHNFVYGEEFLSLESILKLSTVALFDKAVDNGEFIDEEIVKSYIFNMYGIEIVDLTEYNKNYPLKEGCVYVIPQGFTAYKHTNASVSLNEDGSYTVTTKVSVLGHDGNSSVLTAKTLFVKNTASSFGFNIIYSEISDDTLQM